MSRNFPKWEDTHWDYEKGNLDDAAKKYTVGVCRRVKAAGGVAHLFVVGRVFEQADVGWLKDLARDGHPIGNHTYDHVNVLAKKPEDIQFRFQPGPVADRGPDAGAGHRRKHPTHHRGPQDARRRGPGRLPHPRRVRGRPGRPAGRPQAGSATSGSRGSAASTPPTR